MAQREIARGEIFELPDPDSHGNQIRAVYDNDLDMLKRLASKGFSMRVCDNMGKTPLHHAAFYCRHEIVDWLLTREEVDINDVTHVQSTPLILLCSSMERRKEQVKMLRRLLTVPDIDVNAKTEEDFTAMEAAAIGRNYELIKILAEHEPFQVPDEILHVLLPEIIYYNPGMIELGYELIDLLYKRNPNIVHQRYGQRLLPFHHSIILTQPKFAIKLIGWATLEEITEPTTEYTALSIAAGRGLYSVVKALLERGADPNLLDGEDEDITALQMACVNDTVRERDEVDFPQTIRLLASLTKAEVLRTVNLEPKGANPFEVTIDNRKLGNIEILNEIFPYPTLLISTDDLQIPMMESALTYLLRTVRHTPRVMEVASNLLQTTPLTEGLEELPCLLAVTFNPDFNDESPKFVQLLLNNGASISQAWKCNYLPILCGSFNPLGMLYLIQNGLFHPEELKALLHLLVQRTVSKISLNSLFLIYLCQEAVGDFTLMEKVMEKVPGCNNVNICQRNSKKRDTPTLQVLARSSVRSLLFRRSPVPANDCLTKSLPPIVQEYILYFNELNHHSIREKFLASRNLLHTRPDLTRYITLS